MSHNTEAQTVNVDVKLSKNKFYVDEGHPHIILKDSPNINEYKKLINACPAGLYKLEKDGSIKFDSAGCLECGTCRFLCADSIIEKWEYPRGTFGIEYRYG